MTTSNITLLIVSIILIVLIILFVVFRWLRNMMNRKHEEFLKTPLFYPVRRVESMSNFFGVKSAGRGQFRGNGFLALTDKGVAFKMYLGGKELDIPYRDILDISTTKTFLGKTLFKDLLVIHYKTMNGEDTAAWFVNDVPGWIEHIKKNMV